LVKASWIILAVPEATHKLSARNQLVGKVERIVPGHVNSEVLLRLESGNTISAVVTHDSVGSLGLAPGAEVSAVFKASSVILGITE
jgi:molybdate transport system regulatory protein